MTKKKKQAGLLVTLALCAGAMLGGCATPRDGASPGGETAASLTGEQRAAVDRAVAKVKPALVRIKVVVPDYDDGREEKFIAFGSGTIISEDGYVMTNHHVAGKVVQVICTMANREEIPATLVGTDPATDIAIVKLQPKTPTKFPFAGFGDSSKVKVGDTVMALGSPAALSQSVTLGIISNTEMITPASWGDYEFELDGESVGELVRWIGHDAAIYPGNSGGPLIDLNGDIIGVNEIGIGLGGAIPGNLAHKVAAQIMETGMVRRAYVGARLQPMLKNATERNGVLVSSVLKDSPAEKAGLKAGDIILQINQDEIEGHFQEDLPGINNVIADLPVGKEATFVLLRDGARQTITVTPEQREPALIPEHEVREWGMTARNLTLWSKIDLARESKSGVLVTSTRSGGPISEAKPEIRPEDVIVKVNDEEVNNLEQLLAATKRILEGRTDMVPVLVTYEREAEQFVTVAKIGVDKLQDPGRDVRKAWLPAQTQVITREVAEQMKQPDLKGVRVTRLYADRPETFPLKVGDLLLKIDGEVIDASKPVDAEVFNTMVRQYRVGAEVQLDILRDGVPRKEKMTLVAAPGKTREMKRYRDLDFEFIAREAAFDDRENPMFAGQEINLVIDSVTSGGWAHLAGLRIGDALISIDGTPVKTVAEVESSMKKVRDEKKNSVVFFVRRKTQSAYLEMEPKW